MDNIKLKKKKKVDTGADATTVSPKPWPPG